MTCTALLVTLMMVCTVSFIWGTHLDSVLKEVLSATGKDPRLHKTRDGNDKHGPFRKALVPESMRLTKRYDPPAPTYPPIEPCTSTNQACAKLERLQDGSSYRVTKRSYCKCEDGTPDCDETWMIGNDNSVTFKPKDNVNKDCQLKFCRNLPDHKKCPSTFGMPHLVSVTGKAIEDNTVSIARPKWIFNPVCKCPYNYFVEYEQKFIRDWTWDWSFTCYKPIKECTHNGQVCGIMTRVSGGTPSFNSACECSSLTSRDCSQTWEDDGLTRTATHNYSIEYQYKFCVELPQVDSCTGILVGKTAGILTSTITFTGEEVMVYMPECKCPNKVLLYEVNRTNNTMTFVCDKPLALMDGICAQRYFERGSQKVDIIKYPYICPKGLSYQKCPEPEKYVSFGTELDGKYTESRCIRI